MVLAEAKKVIRLAEKSVGENDGELGMDFVLGVLDMVGEQEETDISKADKNPAKRNYKTKRCVTCGKEFTPKSGVQKECDDCKGKAKDEVRSTAEELAAMD